MISKLTRCGPAACEIAPALLDHRRREVGEEKPSVGIARQQMPAEQSRCRSQARARGERRVAVGDAPAAQPRRAANQHARHRSPPAPRSSGRRRRYGWRACAKSRTWLAHHSGCFRGSTWPPVSDQRIVSLPQMASLMACGTTASSRAARASVGQASSALALLSSQSISQPSPSSSRSTLRASGGAKGSVPQPRQKAARVWPASRRSPRRMPATRDGGI